MPPSCWKPVDLDEKFGIVIANFEGSSIKDGADIFVGRFVHIYEKTENWYRGCLYDQHQKIGIFPRNIIYHKKCNVISGEGLLEKIEPEIDPLVLYIDHLTPFFMDEIFESYLDRVQMNDHLHYSDRKGELYMQQINALMIGYRLQCFMNENATDTYLYQTKKSKLQHHWQVNSRLFNVLEKRSDVLVLPSLSPASILYPLSSGDSGSLIPLHNKKFHLFIENNSPFEENKIEIVIGIYSAKLNEYTSELIVCHTFEPKTSSICGIIKDIPPLDEHQMLIIKIFKIGPISDDRAEKNSIECRKPFAYSVIELKGNSDKLDKGYDISAPLFQHNDFVMLDGMKIKEVLAQNDSSGSISLKLQRFYGSFDQVLRSPEISCKAANLTVVKSIPIEDSEKSSEENLTELYLHLKRCDFEKFSKGKLHNIKIQICVYKSNMRERGCIYYGKNDATDEYQSPVYYHNNTPVFNDLIKISLRSDISDLEIRFFVHHISRNKTRKTRSDIAIAVFRPIAVIEKSLSRPNVSHALVVHKGGIDTMNFRDHSFFSTLKCEQVISDDEDKGKQLPDSIFIRPCLITNNYTADELISNLLIRQPTDTQNLPQLLNNIETTSSGHERRKFCFRMLETLWRFLEEKHGIPEIYMSTLNRFKDIYNSNLNREELKTLAHNIQNVDYLYRYFIDNMKTFLTAYNHMKSVRLTIKHMDLFLVVLEILVAKSTEITKTMFANEMFEILNEIEISESNEHGSQLYSLYSSELPRILHVLSDTLTVKQQLALVVNVCKVKTNGSLFIQMTLLENVLETPMFADLECHEKLCSIFVSTITAIGNAMEYKSYYLKTEAMMKFYERHAEIVKNQPIDLTVKLVCALQNMVCELLTPASDLLEKNNDMMIKLIVCFISFLKLINEKVLTAIISNNNNLLKITKQFTLAFRSIIAYKDIPLNYRFHWGLIYSEIYRLFALLHCAILVDHNAGKIRSSCFNYVQSFSTIFILAHEAHSSLLPQSQRQDFNSVFGRLSDCTLFLISKLYEALKGDLGDKNFEHLRDFVKVCLLPNESLSRAAITVLLGIIKLRLESSTESISDQISSELIDIFYFHFNDSGDKTKISIGVFLTRYKEQSHLCWNLVIGDVKESGLQIMKSTYDALDHLYEQQNLPKVTLAPFMTLYTRYNHVLYNMKNDARIVPNAVLRYIEMLLEMNYFELAGFAFLILADPLEWSNTELSEISVSELVLPSPHAGSTTSLGDFSVSSSVPTHCESLVLFTNDPSKPFILLKNIPRQSSKMRKILYLQSSIICFLQSSHKLYAADYIKEIINFYERTNSTQVFKEIANYYMQLSDIYTYSTETPPLPFKYFLIGIFGEKAPPKVRNLEFVVISSPQSYAFNLVESFQKEFPQAKVHHKSDPNVDMRKSTEMEVLIQKVEPYVDRISGEVPEPSILPQPTDMFMLELPAKFESKFNVNEVSTSAKIRKIIQIVAKLPSHMKMAEVCSTEEKFFSPIDLAIDAMESKTVQLAREMTETPIRMFSMLVKGVVDAPINGGPKNYKDAFFDRKYLEAYPEQAGKVKILRESFKSQMDRTKISLEYLFDNAPDSYIPLFLEMKRMYNESCTLYNSELGLGCQPLERTLEVAAVPDSAANAPLSGSNPNIRTRTYSNLTNSKTANINSSSTTGMSPEMSNLSGSPVDCSNILNQSFGSAGSKNQDKFNTFIGRNLLTKFGSMRKLKNIKPGSQSIKNNSMITPSNHSPLVSMNSYDFVDDNQKGSVSNTPTHSSSSGTSQSECRSDPSSSLEGKPTIKSLFGNRR